MVDIKQSNYFKWLDKLNIINRKKQSFQKDFEKIKKYYHYPEFFIPLLLNYPTPEVLFTDLQLSEGDNKQKLTYLPPKATFELDGQENGYAKIRKINDCDVPNLLVKENGSSDAPHKGYVKVTSLTSFTFKPEKFNDIVVLKSPIAISSGDFIGYIGHNQLKKNSFNEPTQASIATIKRPSDKKLPQLLHVELFTGEDLSAFITQTRALADNLPESEKNLILVEKGARLIQASEADGKLNSGLGIKFTSDKDSYYVKINLEYTLNSKEYYADNNLAAQSKVDEKIEENDNDLSNKTLEITLTADNKEQLENRYNKTYPQLTKSDIPDKVELVEVDHNSSSVKIRFCVNTKHYWIASKDVSHLFGQDGTLNTVIPYWNNFPLSFDNLPPATKDNTVHFPRTVSLDSLSNENLITIEDESTDSIWVKVTAGNEERWSITGWVNIKKDAQEHVKRISPWHWQGFETVIEKASVGEFYTKINDNRAGTLDIKEYTDSMKAMHKILIESLLYSVQRKKGLPPFTIEFLKDGLRNSWIAEMIGHLIIKYESEWYADEALTKWNEIDSLFEKETQKQKKLIEKWLDDNNITMPYKRNSALNSVDEAHEETKIHWQLEKEQRIKPSLWWREVAQSQATQSSNNQTPQTPALSNLSADGKAWFIHPVSIMGRFISPGIVTYHIYHDGKIEKHIPLEISKGYEQKYKYVYHDVNKNQHEIGIFNIHKTKAMERGNVALDYDVELINVKEFEEGYSSKEGNVKAKFKTFNSDSKRWYINPDCFAGLLGAMLELNVDYLGFNGFSTYDAKSVQSKSHINGVAGDLRYISTKRNGELTWLSYSTFDFNEQEKFNIALHKFGWARTSLMYSEYFTYNKKANTLLSYTKHMHKEGKGGYEHYHHLHICGFDFNLIIKKQD
ncbi:hypothetical protein H3S88_09155 [Gilliamella sp. B14448G11]|uniref:hypothetical protein n=1 Tax=unclassified Gilliamella TaxID=2685620 RepID=UPI0018DDD3AA|nr:MULTISPECIES: hypothetical protein [unclassified Gilliamella]MBI0028905.1 hypothetical protein [Gilliamella sp. B14448G7]MBI0035835.1 hypothetical protein [Gilliamella sp. B14448G11]MBI0043660.1 hypothetical protein [Gilliamella sp. B14448G12]